MWQSFYEDTGTTLLPYYLTITNYCKELPNKDYDTCRKERFIGSTESWTAPLGFRVQQLGGNG
jgi:hypothetical protein